MNIDVHIIEQNTDTPMLVDRILTVFLTVMSNIGVATTMEHFLLMKVKSLHNANYQNITKLYIHISLLANLR